MARTPKFDIDAPLLIAGHPIVAATREPLARWLKQRRGFWAKDRSGWRDVVLAEVVEVADAPVHFRIETEHGGGWLHPRGDADAVRVGTWILVNAYERSIVDADIPMLDERHDAPLPEDAVAVVESVDSVRGHTSVRATWTTPSGLTPRVVVTDAGADAPAPVLGDELGPLVLHAGRPHVSRAVADADV